MDSKREPNERENRFAGYILDALQELHEAASDAKAVPTQRSLIAAIVENLNEYRAELRPEPTAGDRETAEELIRHHLEQANFIKYDAVEVGASFHLLVDKVAAALSAARGEERKKILREATCKIDSLKGECSRHFESIIVFMQDVIWAIYGNEEADEDTKLSLNEYDVKRQEGLAEETRTELEAAAREVVLQRKNHAIILNKDHDGDFIGALNALAVLTPEVGE